MSVRDITLFGVDGSVWPLTDRAHTGVFLKSNPLELRASSGEAVAGTLELVVADNDPDGAELDPISVTMPKWRRAWSPRRYATLRINDPDSWDAWLPLRLSEVIPDLPPLEPEGFEEFTQAVVSDPRHPYWRRTHVYQTTECVVVNGGDHEMWASVQWLRGGTVTMPSGATFTLPTVPEWRRILLDPFESCDVVSQDGVRDEVLWRQLRGRVFPESVPVGETRTFRIPQGAHLLIDERVDDPWR